MNPSAAAMRLAAVVHDDACSPLVNSLLAEFARSASRGSWRVGGLVYERRAQASGRSRMYLVDVSGGRDFCISQDLGSQSGGCCVDPHAVAAAGAVLRQALAERVDLAIVNRFGKLEAGGGGLAAELAALVAEDVPVLTTVSHKQLDAWRAFTGSLGIELPADPAALHDWLRGCVGTPRTLPGRAAA